MKRIAVILLLAAAACRQPEDAAVKIVVGATLVGPAGAPRIQHSIVLVENGVVKAVGEQTTVPIPTGSMKINGLGKFVAALETGKTIEPGQPANFGLFDTDPAVDAGYAARPHGRMTGGKWEPAQ